MFWLLQVSKIQDGGQNGCRFPILIIISKPFKLKTQVRYPNICFEVWTIYCKHNYNTSTLASTQNPKWPLFGVQDGIQNPRHFRILIIIYQPYILETQVRYPNICFEVWEIYLKHYQDVLTPASTQNPRWQPIKWPLCSYFDHNFSSKDNENTHKVSYSLDIVIFPFLVSPCWKGYAFPDKW